MAGGVRAFRSEGGCYNAFTNTACGPTVRCDMTMPNTAAGMAGVEEYIVFPDPPERGPNDLTTFDHLASTGSVHHLRQHLGDMETTLVAGERYMSLAPTGDMTGVRYPDLLVAFGVDPKEYRRRNAYVISDQGKPPDLVMEIASSGNRAGGCDGEAG